MENYSTHQTKTNLSKIIRLVEKGEEVIISRSGKPVARLVAYKASEDIKKRPKVGKTTSEKVKCSADAFASLSDRELKEWGL